MSGKASPGKKKKESKEGKKSKGSKKGIPTSSKEDDKARQLQQLSAQLVLVQGKVAALEADQGAKDAELWAVKSKQEADSLTYGDVLRHQQQEQDELQQHAWELERRLEAAQKQIAGLQLDLQAAQAAGEAEDGGSIDAPSYKRMLSAVRSKDDLIAQQETDLAQLQNKLQQAHDSLYQAYEQIENLKYKASSRSQLLFLFDEHCLARIERHRLTGKVPVQRPGQVLCCAGGRWLLQCGTMLTGEGAIESCIHVLDVHSGQWQPAFREPCSQALAGHAAVAVKNRLVAFGGEDLRGGPRIFSPDAMGWVQVPPLADARAPAPCPRKGHAMAYCESTNSVYLFGGMGQGRQLLNDLWRLRMDNYEWTKLDSLPSSREQGVLGGDRAAQGEALPKPCCNAAMAVSEDGGQLWLFGGSTQGGKSQSTLWWYEVDSRTWSWVELAADSLYVEPREGHVMTCVRRWLLVTGGSCRQSTGERKQLRDTLVFDTLLGAWDCIDANCWAAAEPSMPRLGCGSSSRGPGPAAELGCAAAGQLHNLSSANCTFVGSNLLMLKQNASGAQDELQVVSLQLLDEVARRRVAKRASLVVIERLELLDGATITATSIKVAWQSPTRNAHKLVGFKLMVTAEDGSVHYVYQGKERSFELQKLTPDTEYILAVKAVYDDASFIWSESKAFRTIAKNKGQE